MKKIISKIALFILPIIVFTIFMEYNLGRINNTYSIKKTLLERQLQSIEVLILGTSQPFYGINPAYFNLKGFNISDHCQTIFYDKNITLNYIDKMPHLKYVIIPINYISFTYDFEDTKEKFRDYFYYQYWGIKFPKLKFTDLRMYSKLFLYEPWRSLIYLKKKFKVIDYASKDIIENGWIFKDTVNNYADINDDIAYRTVLLHNSFYRSKKIDLNVEYFGQLLTELNKRNIQPILITMPVTNNYYKFIDKVRVQRTLNFIKTMCNKHHCKYYNYLTDKRFVKRDFHDVDHLNFIGAQKFSKIINTEILQHSYAYKISNSKFNN